MHGAGGQWVEIAEGLELVGRGTLAPCYYLAGEQEFWARRWIEQARRKFLGSGYDDGFVVRDSVGQWTELDLVLRTTGFFSQRRMVLVHNVLWTGKEQQLKAYLDHPDPDVLLVLWDRKISPSVAKLFGVRQVIELKAMSLTLQRRFVKQEAKKRHVQVTAEGVEMLLEVLLHDEQQVLHELDKMSLYDGSRNWDELSVQQFVPPLPHDTALWRLTDPLAQRQGAATLQQAQLLLREGKAPLLIFIVAVRHLIQLNRALQAKSRGTSLQEFARVQGLKEFPAKKLWQYTRYWSAPEMEHLLIQAAFIDRALKTGYGEPEAWVLSYLALLGRIRT
jgi:DNA polymerase-3 subunit delta